MAEGCSVISEFDSLYNDAYYSWDPYFPLADRDLRYYLGDQWDEQEKQKLFQEGRSTFVFNRVRPIIDFITGYQRQHRNSSVVVPVEDGDQVVADQMTKVIYHVMNYGEGYRVLSDCFSGAVKTGWNLLSLWMDYREDPENGDIRFSREPYNGFICDPYFTNLDWSDCQYILKRKYLSRYHVSSLLPGKEKEVDELYHMGWERDDKFTWLPYQRQPNGQQLMAYNEMYRQKWRYSDVVLDTQTGEYRKWPGDSEALREFLDLYPQLKVVKQPDRYIQRNIIVNDNEMHEDENPFDLDEYSFVPVVAIFESESDQWGLKIQSKIRAMVDPQREANRRRSQMTDLLDSQINSGWIADEKSVINPRSLFQTSQGKVIWRREDAKPGAVEKIQPSQIPPSMFQLQELYDRDMKDIAGINDAAFGQIESANESGVMQLIRQGASIANMQELFDNLRYAQKNMTKKIIKLIQTWTPEKISRIINEPVSPEFFDADLSKYDVEVVEGVLTSTQKQLYFRQLVEIQQLGAPVTGEMLARAAPIQGKSEYLEEIKKNQEQQAQQAQEQQQLQQRLLASQENATQAKAISDVALSKERFTRAVANNSLSDERAAAAVEDRADAALNRIKAVKEMQAIDDDRLIKYIGIIKQLEEMSRQDEQEIKKDDVAIASEGQQIGDQLLGVPKVPAPQGQVVNENVTEVTQ